MIRCMITLSLTLCRHEKLVYSGENRCKQPCKSVAGAFCDPFAAESSITTADWHPNVHLECMVRQLPITNRVFRCCLHCVGTSRYWDQTYSSSTSSLRRFYSIKCGHKNSQTLLHRIFSLGRVGGTAYRNCILDSVTAASLRWRLRRERACECKRHQHVIYYIFRRLGYLERVF